jgi:hypothetical protein
VRTLDKRNTGSIMNSCEGLEFSTPPRRGLLCLLDAACRPGDISAFLTTSGSGSYHVI